MADKTLTTANSAATLAVRGLYPIPFVLQGYATDDSFSTEDVNPAEVQMGVDGKLSSGYVPVPKVVTYMFQADSPSLAYLDQVIATQESQNENLIFDGTMFIQGTQDKIAMTKGFLTSYTPPGNSKKTLQPRKFTITFEKFTKAPI